MTSVACKIADFFGIVTIQDIRKESLRLDRLDEELYEKLVSEDTQTIITDNIRRKKALMELAKKAPKD
jgi:hypothetical protein